MVADGYSRHFHTAKGTGFCRRWVAYSHSTIIRNQVGVVLDSIGSYLVHQAAPDGSGHSGQFNNAILPKAFHTSPKQNKEF